MPIRMDRLDALEFLEASSNNRTDCCDPLSLHCAMDTCCSSLDPMAVEAASPTERQTRALYVAMNRFRVKRGSEHAFEAVWMTRDVYLSKAVGFVAFDLLRGPQNEDHTLYAFHTIWESEADFAAWTRSAASCATHKEAGETSPLYLGRPQFEGFVSIQSIAPAA